MPEPFAILGAGPAGSAAALALLRAGARAVLHERSRLPRHKVCGEFYSPEIYPVLEELGVAGAFLAARPARVTHAELHFERSERRFRLPEPAWGLSRYAFDYLLLRAAVDRGADLCSGAPARPAIAACGRRGAAPRGRRLFGFKAHFTGPAHDAVELYFFSGGYCGLCPIEDGRTNVCGLAAEHLLAARGFRVDDLLARVARLRERLACLEQAASWRLTGPLRFGPAEPQPPGVLAAGDAFCFVDPFTGSGLLAAVRTGSWAAQALVEGGDYASRCRQFYRRQLSTAAILRRALTWGFLDPLGDLLPGPLLFRLTRPRVQWRP